MQNMQNNKRKRKEKYTGRKRGKKWKEKGGGKERGKGGEEGDDGGGGRGCGVLNRRRNGEENRGG